MKLNIKVTNNDLAKDGAWVDWALVEGVSVKMRRSSLAEPQRHLLSMAKRNRKAMRTNDVKAQKRLMVTFLAEHIITDWKGLTDNKKEFKFNQENAIAALKEDDDFYLFVLQEADNVMNFMEEDDTTVEDRAEELKK